MKQVSYDKLLNITSQPGITCPLINALLFDGSQRSRIVRFKIDEFDDKAYIDGSELNELLKTMNNLENWATDIITTYENLSEETLELIFEDYGNDINSIIAEINKGVNNDFDYTLQHEVKQLNNAASEVESIINNYLEKINYLEDEEKELDELDNLLSSIDQEEEEDKYEEILDDINNKKKDIDKLKSLIDDIKIDFKYAEISFFNQSSDLSDVLEEVRTRNDELRTEAKGLKDIIIEYAKEELELYQPIEFLNNKYSSKDIVNLGIIYKDEREKIKLFKYLKDKNIINEEQYKFHTEIDKINIKESLESLLSTLKNNQFKGVRYYENAEDFFNRKEPQSLLIKKNKNKMEFK